ncbi:MAG TPA: hypothetical protein VK327_11460 [Candidatus Paceibacterota bacterium]|nr:hypothetical protein [Candidatus Paceibacterota bacterium]
MKTKFLLIFAATFVVSASNAAVYVVEPDNYADGTVLDHIIPPVNLSTAGSDNRPVSIFHTTASHDGFGYASTGTQVFGAAGVYFFNFGQRLRMDFNAPVSAISIDFIGGEYSHTEIGRLDAYSSAGVLLGSYITNPRSSGSIETMSVSRSAGDIAWAVAYVPPNQGSFGRLDNLQFTVVPEPSVAAMLSGAMACFWLQRRSSLRNGLQKT